MLSRRYNEFTDRKEVQAIYDKFHKGEFGVPIRSIEQVVVIDEGKIIGYGGIEPLLEGTMILDLSVSNRKKIEAIGRIVRAGRVATQLAGFERFYAFPSPPSFNQLLQKHFNFKPCDQIVYLEV